MAKVHGNRKEVREREDVPDLCFGGIGNVLAEQDRGLLEVGGLTRKDAEVIQYTASKFRAKLTTVKANKLNHVGRLTYIQSVRFHSSVLHVHCPLLQDLCGQNQCYYSHILVGRYSR